MSETRPNVTSEVPTQRPTYEEKKTKLTQKSMQLYNEVQELNNPSKNCQNSTVISSSMGKNGKVFTLLIIVTGIFLNPYQTSILCIDGNSPGWLVSMWWITNDELFKKHFTEKRKTTPQLMMGTLVPNEGKLVIDEVATSDDQGQTLRIRADGLTLTYSSTTMQLSLIPDNEEYYGTRKQPVTLIQNTTYRALSSGTCSFFHAKEDITVKAQTSLEMYQERSGVCGKSGPVTLMIMRLSNKGAGKKYKTFVDKILMTVIKGGSPDIRIPIECNHQDPILEWHSWTVVLCESKLSALVDHYWTKYLSEHHKSSDDFEMAEFVTFDITSDVYACPLKFKGDKVTVSMPKECKFLELWAHNSRVDAVYNKLLKDERGSKHLQSVFECLEKIPEENCSENTLKSNTSLTDFIGDFITDEFMPSSSCYPTMGICNRLLPPPNQLACREDGKGFFSLSYNDEVHLRMGKWGQPTNRICILFKLLEHHKKGTTKTNINNCCSDFTLTH